jgi:hypothetical protein
MVFDCAVLFRREPAEGSGGAVFRANGGRPGEGIVDLEEVVVLFVFIVSVGCRRGLTE